MAVATINPVVGDVVSAGIRFGELGFWRLGTECFSNPGQRARARCRSVTTVAVASTSAARSAKVQDGLIDYAEAELCLREGEFDRSIALGGCAGSTLDGDLAARAYLVAARSAHLANRVPQRARQLAAIAAPTLVMHGDQDGLIPLARGRELAGCL